MYEDKLDIRMDSFYPEEWEQILKTRSGNINSDKGVFIYENVSALGEENRDVVTEKAAGSCYHTYRPMMYLVRV